MSTLATVFGYGLLSARPAASIAGRQYYATDTSLLYRDNGSTWDTLSTSGLTNPMTTAGDIIVGGASGTPARLAAGTAGYALVGGGAGVASSYQAAIPIAKRQGGSSSDWSSGGSTNYTPAGAATVQVGVTAAQTVATGPITVTFPQAFTNPPWVNASIGDATVNGNGLTVMVTNVTTTGFDCYPSSVPAPATATGKVHWIAIGI